VSLSKCILRDNGGTAVELLSQAKAIIRRCHIVSALGGVLTKENGCSTTCTGNLCVVPLTIKLPPGFQRAENDDMLSG
jgi:hypothetical protein